MTVVRGATTAPFLVATSPVEDHDSPCARDTGSQIPSTVLDTRAEAPFPLIGASAQYAADSFAC
jgi:hypothetical protein